MSEQTESAELSRLVERVRDYLEQERGVDPSTVHEDTNFRDELQIDSLDLAAMALALETEYGIRLDDEEILRIETVGDACDLILSSAARSTH
jgi:acyl carrier protein